MPGSINRCFSDLEARGVLPTKVITLNAENGTISHGRIRFDLSELIADFYDVERVIFASEDEYIGNFAYQREGDEIVLGYEAGAEYRVAYKPSIPRVFGYTENDTEIELPEDIAALIPYFIKGDLYREDETGEASEARNWYEAGISARGTRTTANAGITSSVRSLYSSEEV